MAMHAVTASASDQLRPDSFWSSLALHKVPPRFLIIAAGVSYLILAISYLQSVPAWLAFGLAFIPWVLIVFVELEWSYEHFHWFALFGLMAFVQTIHYSEHCIEVIQVHIFHVPTHQALAIFGALNVEGVHFVGDTFLSVGTLVLLTKYPRNPWLWAAIPFQTLHQAEHSFLMFNYVFHPGATGGAFFGLFNDGPRFAGGPGLLGTDRDLGFGGAIGGGIGLSRPDLHWIYNTLYTLPFAAALVYQLKRTYDQALVRMLPDLSEKERAEVSRKLETFNFVASQTLLAPGDNVDRLYIITQGQVGVYRVEGDHREHEEASLTKGDWYGAEGLLVANAVHSHLVRAKTDVSVLAMDGQTFRNVLGISQRTRNRMAHVEEQRHGLVAAN